MKMRKIAGVRAPCHHQLEEEERREGGGGGLVGLSSINGPSERQEGCTVAWCNGGVRGGREVAASGVRREERRVWDWGSIA